MTTRRARGCRPLSTLFALLFLTSCAEPQRPAELIIGTGSLGGNYHVIGHSLARLARESHDDLPYEIRYETSAGSVANINNLANGEIQFGIAQADHQYWAVNGLGEWEAAGPQQGLRSLFSIYLELVTLTTGKDSDIRTIADLKDRTVDLGTPDSGTQRNAIDVLRVAGLDPQTDLRMEQSDLEERLAKFMRSELDAFFFTTGHPSSELRLATYTQRGVRFVPLSDVDRLTSEHPFYSRAMLPTDHYPAAEGRGPVETIGVNATLLSSASVPDDVVYLMTKTVLENLDALADVRIDLSTLTSGEFLEGLTAPIHAGALRYYGEVGIEVPESLR